MVAMTTAATADRAVMTMQMTMAMMPITMRMMKNDDAGADGDDADYDDGHVLHRGPAGSHISVVQLCGQEKVVALGRRVEARLSSPLAGGVERAKARRRGLER